MKFDMSNLKKIKFNGFSKKENKSDKTASKKSINVFADSKLAKLKNIKNIFQKYDYDINKVVGVEKEKIDNNKYKENKYILLADKKLIRAYRDSLKTTALLSGYIPIEDAIPFSFEIEKSMIAKLEKEEVKEYIETHVYENGGLKEEEEYEIKYTLIEDEENENIYKVETVIVSKTAIEFRFRDLIEEVGYIDYIAFPAFSYKSLYEANILKKANDLFIVLLDDKIFLTYYSDGNLQKILTINGGIDNVYERLEASVKIKNFNKKIFWQLLNKKGLNKNKYSPQEAKVYEILRNEFVKLYHSINIEGLDIEIDRIFITTKHGNVENLSNLVAKQVSKEVFDFQFYEEYNLDKLPIDPFLFLAMLEAHIAYKSENQNYNFSFFLRPPTFFYRPSGQIVLTFTISLILSAAYPLYLYFQSIQYEKENMSLRTQNQNLSIQLARLENGIKKLKAKKKKLEEKKSDLLKKIADSIDFINEVYKFKYSYLPVSQTLFELTRIMNKNDVILEQLEYKKGVYVFKVNADYDFQIPNLIYDFHTHNFKVYTDKIEKTPQGYTSIIRIAQ